MASRTKSKPPGKLFPVLHTLILLITLIPASQPVSAKTDDTWITPETLSAGGLHTCGLKSDGTVACWGDNSYNQATPPAGTFSQVSAGYYHSCGLKSDGSLICWNSDADGQLFQYQSYQPMIMR